MLFWTALGFDIDQIESVPVEGQTDMLTPILNSRGECTAANDYVASFQFEQPAKFAYIPLRDTYVKLSVETRLTNAVASPQTMEKAFEDLLLEANYLMRWMCLNGPHQIKVIWPDKTRLLRAKSRVVTEPLNIMPLSASASLNGQFFEISVNTTKGRGAIVELSFPSDNIFGMHENILGYDKDKGKFKTHIVQNSMALGVRGQHCTITSGDLHLSRALISPDLNNQCLVAVFPSELEKNDQPYLPLNRLSSSCTYDKISFNVFSQHRNETFTVSGEKFSYLLVFEIRGYT